MTRTPLPITLWEKERPWSNPPAVPWIMSSGGPRPCSAYSMSPSRVWITRLLPVTRCSAACTSERNASQIAAMPIAATTRRMAHPTDRIGALSIALFRADVEAAGGGHAAGQAAVDHQRLAVDVGTLVRSEEQRGAGDVGRLATALQRIQFADSVGDAFCPSRIVDDLGHAGLDQPGTERIDADVRARQ